ncbi:MAG: hypothetical protein COW88_02200 [Candidatus Lloydbacteria bacterium CG22_combo_CG10-13_8_21_14_all_47_15]|uniref:Uncharacterized protein n=1 Tax=Candidatus Lloydbacteria bacterium CG22_combo_CG10-13_8_21_14_all_47_15 TaxID=1974635 RepID=A0A2H0CU32_9BACT|nr:MAG: hypothetical protein COW88_02200 [Candidatus Lloydbacteria bacterium CG22_combo_CG10-13_8_21_14_all_47_15]
MLTRENKKAVVAILILIGVAAFAAFVGERYGGEIGTLTFEKRNAGLDAYSAQQIAKLDTDGDGLYDWEETLWQTNPNNPDTDGDGTTDGDELNAGRHPLVAGPDDDLTKIVPTVYGVTGGDTTDQPSTISESVARELFSSYLVLRQSGEFSEETGKKLVASVADDVFAFGKGAPAYTLSDITPTSNTQTAVLVYANALFARLSALLSVPSAGTELVLLTDILQTERKSELQKFAILEEEYKTAAESLAGLSVPQVFLEKHIELLNALMTFSNTAGYFQNSFIDPIQTIAGLQLYGNARAILGTAIQEIDALLPAYGVVFDEATGIYTTQ